MDIISYLYLLKNEYVILLLIAILPSLFLVYLLYVNDKKKRGPIDKVIKIFTLGVLSIVPIILIETLLSRFGEGFSNYILVHDIFVAFIVAGLCEEGVKFLIIKIFVYNEQYFDRVLDGIIYTVCVGLGFGCAENISYTLWSL